MDTAYAEISPCNFAEVVTRETGQSKFHFIGESSGALRAGTRVPSSRAMASMLGVARASVVAAYEQLIAEGYVESRHGSIGLLLAFCSSSTSWTLQQGHQSAERKNTSMAPFVPMIDCSVQAFPFWSFRLKSGTCSPT